MTRAGTAFGEALYRGDWTTVGVIALIAIIAIIITVARLFEDR